MKRKAHLQLPNGATLYVDKPFGEDMKKIRMWLFLLIVFIFNSLLFADSIPTMDLTAKGSSGFLESAFFQQADPRDTGSGEVIPFLTIQGKGTEQGYNTDGPFEPGFDMKRGGKPGDPQGFTHSLALPDVPLVLLDGTNYRQFLLDINESNKKGDWLLSLDALQIYQAVSGNLDSFQSITGNSLVYDLDSGTDRWIGLGDLNAGNGSGDYFVYIPDDSFSSNPNAYIYLYSQFGQQSGWESSGGFEEWAVLKKEELVTLDHDIPLQTPEPTSLLLLGSGIVGLGFIILRKRKA